MLKSKWEDRIKIRISGYALDLTRSGCEAVSNKEMNFWLLRGVCFLDRLSF
jgi:hypothetical protein